MLKKKKVWPTLGNIFAFFGSCVAYNKNDPYQIFFEKDLVLLI
jgi:hypothetical protein